MSARIISTVGRAIDVIVAGRVVSHLRFAAGVCVLAAGLLMGSAGGAVAVADPDSSGSAAHGMATPTRSQATDGEQPGGKALTPAEDDAGRTSKLGQADNGASSGHRHEKPKKDGTDTKRREERLGPRRRGSRSGRRSSEVVAPVTNVVAPVLTWSRRFTDVVAPVPNVVGAGSQCGRAGSQCGRAGCQSGRAGPDCGRAGRHCGRAGRHCGRAGRHCGRAGSDVIAPVQDMLTSVASAVAR